MEKVLVSETFIVFVTGCCMHWCFTCRSELRSGEDGRLVDPARISCYCKRK